MAQIYFAILTAIGEAKLANATALGTTLQLTKMAVGDGNGATPIPNRNQTALVHENRRAPLNTLFVDPANASQLVAEQIIPEDIGGWWIRELGLYDAAGDLCAVANCPDTYKPVLASGSGRTQIIRMVLIVTNTSAVELKIDPSVVLATRGHVDQTMAAHTAAADPHPQYVTDVDLAAHNAAADPHPQYLTSAEGDAKVAAAVAALVESSPATLDTLAELATALGNDANFAATITNLLALKAPLASPALTGSPTAPTPDQFDSSTKLANMEALQRALGNFRGFQAYGTGTSAIAAANAGKLIILGQAGTTVTLPAIAGLPDGATFHFWNNTSNGLATVQRAGADVIWLADTQNASVSVYGGETLTLLKTPAGWYAISGSVTLGKASAAFGSSLAANGYQKLPSGMIIQWCTGTSVAAGGSSVTTLPIAFPNACLFANAIGVGTSQGVTEIIAKSTTSVTVGSGNNTAITTPLVMAIGY